jgi:hypothetical protein
MEQKSEKTLTMAVVGHRDNRKSTLVNSWLGHELTKANEEDYTRGIHLFAILYGSSGSLSGCQVATLHGIKASNAAERTSAIQEKRFVIFLPDVCKHKPGTFPIVIFKILAKCALKYRKMLALMLAEIGDLDMEDLTLYVIEGCGCSKVKVMSREQLVANVQDVSCHNSLEYVSNLESSNGFPKVLAAVKSCISGPNWQGHIIGQQLQQSQSCIAMFVHGGYTARVLENFEEQKSLSTVVEGEPNFTL